MINVGQTPAYKVAFVAKAACSASSYLPDDFTFPPLEPPRRAFGLVAPHQMYTIGALVEGDFFDDGEVQNIKSAIGKALYIWGTVTYEDVVGEARYTNFAHNIFWLRLKDGSERIVGNYVDRHNEAN